MKILYIFPHPDDESFGPAPAMSAQLREGHEVHLLTLTKGEATKQRHRLGISKNEMGEIRYREMLCVERVLGLSGMTVLDLPDNELKKMNPIEIEKVVEAHIHKLKPDVIVTYAVHGISGFHDHLVTHAVVKRVFCSLKDQDFGYPRRLALFTLMKSIDEGSSFNLQGSPEDEIGLVQHCNDEDMERFNRALDCYETYTEVIKKSGVREITTHRVAFEIFGEKIENRLTGITDGMD